MIHIAECNGFESYQTSSGEMVLTPFTYPDGDRVTVFVSKEAEGYRISDNGESALRIMFDDVDVESPKVVALIDGLKATSGVEWMPDESAIEVLAVSDAEVARGIMTVASAAIQLQAIRSNRSVRSVSDFKSKVIHILKEIQTETGIDARYDVHMDEYGTLVADALFMSETPMAIVVASTVQRLLEAEIMWLNAQRINDRTRVIAVVESAAKVGRKETIRANYFTSKTLEFSGHERMFRDSVCGEIAAFWHRH